MRHLFHDTLINLININFILFFNINFIFFNINLILFLHVLCLFSIFLSSGLHEIKEIKQR